MRSRSRGFTIVEIMIVVSIIGILAAIMMPNFMRMRLNANEQVIRGDLRTLSTANESYRSTENPPVYAASIAILQANNYLDMNWINPGNRHGYSFTYAISGNGLTYSVEAVPLSPGVSGVNYYCVDQSGVIQKSSAAGMGSVSGCSGGTPINT